MSFNCRECGQTFETLRSLHAHLKKHDMFVGDYYVKHFAKKDRFTDELIPYKNYSQYFSKDFISADNMRLWCATAPKKEVKDYIVTSFQKKLKNKKLSKIPPSTYLKSGDIPDIEICKKIFGSYNNACKKIKMLPMLSKGLPKNFDKDFTNTKIFIDTREQNPLSFKNEEFLKLDVGDYAVMGDDFDYTFVDRKSFQDFCATVTIGHERFLNEIERCKSLGCYLFVVIETAFDDMEAENSKSYKKFKLDYVFHKMRNIQAKYSDACQFVFSGSRDKSILLIPKILVLGKKLWGVDLEYFWSNQLKQNGLANRKTETKKTLRRYQPTNNRKRGIFG